MFKNVIGSHDIETVGPERELFSVANNKFGVRYPFFRREGSSFPASLMERL